MALPGASKSTLTLDDRLSSSSIDDSKSWSYSSEHIEKKEKKKKKKFVGLLQLFDSFSHKRHKEKKTVMVAS